MIKLSQAWLIDKVIKYTKMTEAFTRDTPAAEAPLGSDKSGDPFNKDWSYPAVVEMLLYLSSNSRPDIQYAVHSAARFSHNPCNSQGQAVKQIVRYLLKTPTEGILFLPRLNQGLDCFVDADFAGQHRNEDDQDPSSVKS